MTLPFPPAVRAGDQLLLSGQVPIDLETLTIVGSDVGEQAAYCVDQIAETLRDHGGTLADVVRMECFLTQAASMPGWDTVFRERFPDGAPTRTTVVCELVVPGALIELQATAYLPAAG